MLPVVMILCDFFQNMARIEICDDESDVPLWERRSLVRGFIRDKRLEIILNSIFTASPNCDLQVFPQNSLNILQSSISFRFLGSNGHMLLLEYSCRQIMRLMQGGSTELHALVITILNSSNHELGLKIDLVQALSFSFS